jgi:hypothetical protein
MIFAKFWATSSASAASLAQRDFVRETTHETTCRLRTAAGETKLWPSIVTEWRPAARGDSCAAHDEAGCVDAGAAIEVVDELSSRGEANAIGTAREVTVTIGSAAGVMPAAESVVAVAPRGCAAATFF